MPRRFFVPALLSAAILFLAADGSVHSQGEFGPAPNATFAPAITQRTQSGVPGGAPGSIGGGTPRPGQPAPVGQPPARDRRIEEPARGTASIRGRVVAADTGAPLRRAQVRVFSITSPGSGGIAQTDAQGDFEVAQLPAGRYNISAQRAGYVSMSFGQRVANQPGTPIELADGQVADKIGFALVRGGAISGRIVDEFGEPVSSVQVQVQRFAYAGGGRRLVMAFAEGGNDRTDDLGQFRLYGLPPGDYYVSATLRNMEFMPMNVTAAPSTDGYAPTYYPGTPNAAEAHRVTVRAAQDVANVTFALSAARLGRIIGRVTTSSGEPFAGGLLMATPRNEALGAGGFGMSPTQVKPDGTFQTAGLPPGTYTLIVQPRGNPIAPNTEVARVDVQVNGEDVRDVFVVTGRGGIIRGRIVTDDGSVPPFRPQQMRILMQPDEPARPMMGMMPSTVHDDWTFEQTGLTERVRLRWSVDSGGGWTLKHALSNGIDLADTPADVGPGQVLEDVEVIVTQKITELSGLVVDGQKRPVVDASVVIFPGDKDRWGFNSRYVRSARPDTNGKYTVRLIPAEGYRAVVVRGLEDGQFADPEFLARALEHATPFEIQEGEKKALDLSVVEVK